MQNYHELLEDILENGRRKESRPGIDTLSVFGRMLRFDLNDGFPLVTSRKIYVPAVIHELLWFLSGDTNVQYLRDNRVRIWDQWADAQGDLGPVYGKQWRHWGMAGEYEVDQLQRVIDEIRANPCSRRHLVSAWNVGELSAMALAPCHYAFQFDVSPSGELSCLVNLRSWDVPIGGPYNIAEYALLTHMVAQVTELAVGDLIVCSGDTHIYVDQIPAVREQLSRGIPPLPRLHLDPGPRSIDEFKAENIQIVGYEPLPAIEFPPPAV